MADNPNLFRKLLDQIQYNSNHRYSYSSTPQTLIVSLLRATINIDNADSLKLLLQQRTYPLSAPENNDAFIVAAEKNSSCCLLPLYKYGVSTEAHTRALAAAYFCKNSDCIKILEDGATTDIKASAQERCKQAEKKRAEDLLNQERDANQAKLLEAVKKPNNAAAIHAFGFLPNWAKAYTQAFQAAIQQASVANLTALLEAGQIIITPQLLQEFATIAGRHFKTDSLNALLQAYPTQETALTQAALTVAASNFNCSVKQPWIKAKTYKSQNKRFKDSKTLSLHPIKKSSYTRNSLRNFLRKEHQLIKNRLGNNYLCYLL